MKVESAEDDAHRVLQCKTSVSASHAAPLLGRMHDQGAEEMVGEQLRLCSQLGSQVENLSNRKNGRRSCFISVQSTLPYLRLLFFSQNLDSYDFVVPLPERASCGAEHDFWNHDGS